MNDDKVLVIERRFAASCKKVYEAWTNPQILQKWWGPVGVTIPELKLDVREGGEWTTTFHSDQMGHRTVSGKYLTVDAPNRLIFTWGWVDNGKRDHETEVEIVLKSSGDGTLMTLTQKSFANIENRDNHNHGWTSSFEKLDSFLNA